MKQIATEAVVRAAALELYQQDPSSMTISNVTDKIGGGSRTTIGPILREIRNDARGGEAADTIPTAVRSRVDGLLQAVMAEASTQAKAEFLARSARADADIAALENDLDVAASEIDELTRKLEEQSSALQQLKLAQEENVRRIGDVEAALVAEKVSHKETTRLLELAWDENAALKRDQAHAALIGGQLESLNVIVAGLQASLPKRRVKRAASSIDQATRHTA